MVGAGVSVGVGVIVGVGVALGLGVVVGVVVDVGTKVGYGVGEGSGQPCRDVRLFEATPDVALGVVLAGTRLGVGIIVAVGEAGAIAAFGNRVATGVRVGVGEWSGQPPTIATSSPASTSSTLTTGVAPTKTMLESVRNTERHSSRQFWEMSGRSALIRR